MEIETVVEGPVEYRIPDVQFVQFSEKFAKLAKRAGKLGVGAVGYDLVRIERMAVIDRQPQFGVEDLGGRERTIPETETCPPGWRRIGTLVFHVITVTGDRPKLAGWRFIGTLQSIKDGETNINILRAVPGESIPAQYREASQFCDHCKTVRRRLDTYIVAHDDGRTAQVGSDCLRDFLGHASPEAIARYYEYLIELAATAGGFEDGGSGGGESGLYIPYVLRLTAARIRVKGWLSRSKARELGEESHAEATANAVETYMDKKSGADRMKRDGVEVTEADEADADAALAWVREMDRSQIGDNDYLWNLFAATRTDDMTYRTLGIVCSLVAAYQREIGRQREKSARYETLRGSQFIGTIKTREVFRLKLVAEPRHYANDFGGSFLCRLEDENGNQVTWWASELLRVETGEFEQRSVWSREAQAIVFEQFPITRPWAIDEWLNVKATVVKHEERDGIKSTTINRAALDVPKPVKAKRSVQSSK
jgi:hypothetical protein